MLLFQLYTIWVQLRQNAPHVYEVIVENMNYLYIYILVHK